MRVSEAKKQRKHVKAPILYNFRWTEGKRRKLARLAKRWDCSVSELIRVAVDRLLENQDQ